MKNPIYLLPNVLTAFGLSCGLFIIFRMNMIPPGEVNTYTLVMMSALLILAAFVDLLDGAVARAMKAESEFGGLFDSLSDGITFGVAPSVVVLKTLPFENNHEIAYLLTTAAMIYSVCGVLRLVRFNVMSHSEKGNEEQILANKKHFTGLPIPAAAAAVVSCNLLLMSKQFQNWFDFSIDTRGWIMFVVLIVLGYFMVSRWKFPSLKTLHIRVTSFQTVFLTVVFAALIFYGVFNHFPITFAVLTWSYIIIAWILSIVRLISGKKSNTLIDFEPDQDDFEEH